ncbi:MAG: hypothetical protein AB1611_21310 [bacterium]
MNVKEDIKEGMGKIAGPIMAASKSIKRVTLNDIYTAFGVSMRNHPDISINASISWAKRLIAKGLN